jgi:hypothetical protein
MSPLTMFFAGVLGSVAAELLRVFQTYSSGRLPRRYREIGFWLVRATIAVMSGGVAVAFNAQSALQALYIGLSVPLVLNSLATSIKIESETTKTPNTPPPVERAERLQKR